ncbi:MAG: hypothetical protein AABW82_05170 [Nanoarchaeota archaeon]
MGKGNNRTKSSKNIVNVGERMQEDMAEVQRRLEEGHYREKLKKGPIDGLSDYARKKRLQANASQAQSDIIEVTKMVAPELSQPQAILPFRLAHFVFAPFPDAKRVIDGLFTLNYLYLDPDGGGYRSAFAPKVVRSFDKISTDIALREYCHKLVTETRVPYGYDLYLNNESREIFLGDRHSPREKGLKLVDRFRT